MFSAAASIVRSGGLFTSRWETWNLILGSLVLFSAGAFSLVGADVSVSVSTQVMRFIVAGFFVNFVHIYFTFALLAVLPEFRAWSSGLSTREKWVTAFKCFLLASLGLTFFYGKHGLYGAHPFWIFIATVLFAIIPIQHSLSQIKGISLLYNRMLLEREEFAHTAQLQRLERWERGLFSGFMFIYIVCAAVYFVSYAVEDSRIATRLGPVLVAAYVGLIFAILAVSWRTPDKSVRWTKTIFNSRLLLFGFIPFSLFAQVVHGVLHGFEYVCIVSKAVQRSSAESAVRRRVLGALAVATVVGIILLLMCPDDGLTSLIWENYQETPVWLRVVSGFAFGFTLLHYYLDRKLFSSGLSSSRENIFPIFSAAPELRQAEHIELLNPALEAHVFKKVVLAGEAKSRG